TVVRRPHGSARRDVEIVDAVPAHLAEAGVGAAGALRHLGGAQLEPSARGLRPARATVSAEPDARATAGIDATAVTWIHRGAVHEIGSGLALLPLVSVVRALEHVAGRGHVHDRILGLPRAAARPP